MKKIYLDYAAATSMDERVIATMQPYFSDRFYNPSALYLGAKSVAGDIADARRRVAGWLGAKPGEIVFTAGGTEANNLAIHGVMSGHPQSNIVVTSIEHESILRPAQTYDCRQVIVNEQGSVDLDDLKKQIDENTTLVSIIYANNEIGTIQPLKKVAELIAAIRKQRQVAGNKTSLYFHTDACQAAAYLDLHINRLGVDLMTLNAGKIYGPKQCGALYVKAGVKLQPQILGGGQERGFRSGTENVPAIMGFALALDLVQKTRLEESKRLQKLQNLFFDLLKQKIKDIQVNGSRQSRLPNNVHITVPGQDNEWLMMALDEAGIQCAAGSACSASRDEPSHVLHALGLSEAAARSSLRLTMGKNTNEKDVRYTVETLAKLVAR